MPCLEGEYCVETGEVFELLQLPLSARSMSMHIAQGKSFNMTCERASFVYYCRLAHLPQTVQTGHDARTASSDMSIPLLAFLDFCSGLHVPTCNGRRAKSNPRTLDMVWG